jgi:hypothetical protein
MNKFTEESQLCHKVANHFPSLLWSVLGEAVSSASMLELILTHGVDPNSSFGGQSEWRLYLELLTQLEEGEQYKEFDRIKVMLRYGANFKQQCTLHSETDDQKREARADELLKEWFDADQFGVLQGIVKRRERKNKKSNFFSKSLRNLQLRVQSKK